MVRSPDKDPTLRDFVHFLHRRRQVVVGLISACMLTALLLCVAATRRYQAVGIVQLQKSSSDSLGLDSMIGGATGGASDALSLNIDIQTQSSILESDPLALAVIQKLDLERNQDFQPRFNPVNWVLGPISPSGAVDRPGASLEDSPRRSQRLIAVFSDNLKVKAVAGTRLIEVDYSNTDPKVAAAVVNELVQQLIEFTFQVRFKATNQASKWLEAQLSDLRDQSEQLQAKVVSMQKETGLFGVGGVDPQGRPVIYSPDLDRLQQTNAALSQAEGARILKGALNQVVQTGDAEQISQLSGTMGAGASQGVASSLSLLQTLRAQEVAAAALVQQDSVTFGAHYPRLIEERASLAAVRRSIEEETKRVGARAQNDFAISEKTEAGLRDVYGKSRHEAEKLNDKTIEYAILQREADQSQQLYQSLLSRLKEAGVLEGLHSSNLTVVSAARAPAKPNKPNVKFYLAAGIVLGMLTGLGAAGLVDAIDNRIQTAEEIGEIGLPVLGLLPKLEGRPNATGLPILAAPHSAYAEALRKLRSTLLLSRSGVPPKLLLVASASPGEGKSTVALNLAIAFAQIRPRVLLVETDMRRPVLRRRLGLPASTGLSQLLSGQDAVAQELALPEVKNLFLILGDPVPPFPADLLSSSRFGELIAGWRENYDIVVVDSPPVLPIADAEELAKYADTVLLIARSGVTTRTSLQRANQTLQPHLRSTNVGVVFNGVSTRSSAYHEYYGYRQSGYYGREGSI